MQVHPARPSADETEPPRCAVCGLTIARVPGGHGPTWVHAVSGTVAAITPPDCLYLDRIAELLSGTEWEAETIEHVADIVRESGREILDVGRGSRERRDEEGR